MKIIIVMCLICIVLDIVSAVLYAKGVFEPSKSSAVFGELLKALMWFTLLLKYLGK